MTPVPMPAAPLLPPSPASSLARTLPGLVARELALAAALAILLVLWLQIPDANAFELLLSMLLALGIALLAGAGLSLIALHLTRRSPLSLRPVTLRSVRPMLRGTAVVLGAALLWLVVDQGLDHLAGNSGLWAGYLNSRFPASARNVFSFAHILGGLTLLWSALAALAAGLLAALAFAVVTTPRELRPALSAVFRSPMVWPSLLLAGVAAVLLTPTLLSWTPGHGLGAESLSLLLRLVLVVLFNALTLALFLQSIAGAILRAAPSAAAGPAPPAATR